MYSHIIYKCRIIVVLSVISLLSVSKVMYRQRKMNEWGLVNMVTNTDSVKCRKFLD